MQWGIQGRLLATSLFLGSDDCLSMNMNAEGQYGQKGFCPVLTSNAC